MALLDNVKAALKLPDLQARIKFVFLMFAVYAFGSHIPIPGVDTSKLGELFKPGSLFGGGLGGLLDMFTGGALKRFSLFALGIMPYINASIIMQLLGVAFPYFEQLQKEGEWGRRKISQYTRYLTVVSAMLQGFGFLFMFQSAGVLGSSAVYSWRGLYVVLMMTAGTAFLMWMAELITQKGIGNGVSLVIFAGIMMRLPTDIAMTLRLVLNGENVGGAVMLFLFFLATVVFIVHFQQAQRKIPVQYTRRTVGTRMMGATSFLPIRVTTAGVIPIIFAIAVALFPAQVVNMIPISSSAWGEWRDRIVRFFSPNESLFALALYFLLVVGFTYFYTAVIFNPQDISDNLKKWGGIIPGIRPGAATTRYIDGVLSRVTFGGALFLATIAVLEYLVPQWTKITTFDLVGGTSVLIVVGVALETMLQLEAQLLLRQYESFIK